MAATGKLEINLAGIQSNWEKLNRQSGLHSQCGAVVKANAYGLGVIEVVNALRAVACDHFYVATMAEAIELRQHVQGDYELIVFGGQAHDCYEECAQYNITPVLVSVEQVHLWSKQNSVAQKPLASIIKIDTGMHRLGLSLDELESLLAEETVLRTCQPSTLMSHLACADEPSHPLNQIQLDRFKQGLKSFRDVFPNVKASLANSSGIFLGADYAFDLVRPGCSLYGINPTPDKPNPMEAVVSLSLPVTQIKQIHAGESAGYGGDYIAPVDRKLAIVFGGYADGLLRSLSNVGFGFCGDTKVPIVGRVSMDAIIFDVSSVPESMLDTETLSIDIIGPHQSVDDLAVLAGTIGYEILTSLGMRYQRYYHKGGV